MKYYDPNLVHSLPSPLLPGKNSLSPLSWIYRSSVLLHRPPGRIIAPVENHWFIPNWEKSSTNGNDSNLSGRQEKQISQRITQRVRLEPDFCTPIDIHISAKRILVKRTTRMTKKNENIVSLPRPSTKLSGPIIRSRHIIMYFWIPSWRPPITRNATYVIFSFAFIRRKYCWEDDRINGNAFSLTQYLFILYTF